VVKKGLSKHAPKVDLGAPFDIEAMEKSEAAKHAWRNKESSCMTAISKNKFYELSMKAKKETPGPDAYHKFKIKTAAKVNEPVNSLPLREIKDESKLPVRGDSY
jgi:hypothetical protein